MFFGTLKNNRALQFVFISLSILFFLLTIRDLTGNPSIFGNFKIGNLAGYEGIICGLSAVYLAIAEVLNETHQKIVLPICPTN
jgi:succinate-acetate transporter protein